MKRRLAGTLGPSLFAAWLLAVFPATVHARREPSTPTFAAREAAASTPARGLTPPTAEELAAQTYLCGPAHAAVLEERRKQIADAATVREARELAIGPARAARGALAVARVVAFWSDGLDVASTRLQAFEQRVRLNATQAEVAREFTRLLGADARADGPVQLADLEMKSMQVHGPGNCHYNTGEIIAVIIGFLLFIIPGLILLIVLC